MDCDLELSLSTSPHLSRICICSVVLIPRLAHQSCLLSSFSFPLPKRHRIKSLPPTLPLTSLSRLGCIQSLFLSCWVIVFFLPAPCCQNGCAYVSFCSPRLPYSPPPVFPSFVSLQHHLSWLSWGDPMFMSEAPLKGKGSVVVVLWQPGGCTAAGRTTGYGDIGSHGRFWRTTADVLLLVWNHCWCYMLCKLHFTFYLLRQSWKDSFRNEFPDDENPEFTCSPKTLALGPLAMNTHPTFIEDYSKVVFPHDVCVLSCWMLDKWTKKKVEPFGKSVPRTISGGSIQNLETFKVVPYQLLSHFISHSHTWDPCNRSILYFLSINSKHGSELGGCNHHVSGTLFPKQANRKETVGLEEVAWWHQRWVLTVCWPIWTHTDENQQETRPQFSFKSSSSTEERWDGDKEAWEQEKKWWLRKRKVMKMQRWSSKEKLHDSGVDESEGARESGPVGRREKAVRMCIIRT